MTRFRRKFRRRTKRPGMLMMPLSLCDQQETWAPSDQQCTGQGRVVAYQLHPGLQGSESKPVALIDPLRQQALVQQTLRRSLTVRGIRFHWSLGVNEIVADQGAEVVHEVRLAVVNMETDSFGAPVMLPNLWTELGPELGDVLWRGFGILYQPSLAGQTAVGGCCFDGAFTGSGLGFRGMVGNYAGSDGHPSPPVHIKTARRLSENNAIFFVYSVKNNIPGETAPDINTSLNLFGVAAVRSNER